MELKCANGWKIGFKIAKKTHSPFLFAPMFVNTGDYFVIGNIMTAKEGPRTPDGKVKSKLGGLHFRPGIHLTDLPYYPVIGQKDKTGKVVAQHDDTVWLLCLYRDGKDYTEIAHANGINPKTGKFNPVNADLDYIPVGGYYRYKTNPTSPVSTIITDEIIVKRVLSDAEVKEICEENGVPYLPRLWELEVSA